MQEFRPFFLEIRLGSHGDVKIDSPMPSGVQRAITSPSPIRIEKKMVPHTWIYILRWEKLFVVFSLFSINDNRGALSTRTARIPDQLC